VAISEAFISKRAIGSYPCFENVVLVVCPVFRRDRRCLVQLVIGPSGWRFLPLFDDLSIGQSLQKAPKKHD